MPRDPLPPRRTTTDRLRDALLALAGAGTVLHHATKAWASVTFEGTRHTIRLRFDGAEAVDAGETFVAALPEHEFALPGQLVADATVTGADHTLLPHPRMEVVCELLLLVEA